MKDIHRLESIPRLVVIGIIQQTGEQSLGGLAEGAELFYFKKAFKKCGHHPELLEELPCGRECRLILRCPEDR